LQAARTFCGLNMQRIHHGYRFLPNWLLEHQGFT
jgi:hypothetical protein